MPRYAFALQFLGKDFAGSQCQITQRTVQGELEKAGQIFFKEEFKTCLASRLDSGVHAKELTGHVDLEYAPSPAELAKANICRHLNGILAADLAVLDFKLVDPSFHARRDAISRSYLYKLRGIGPRYPLENGQVAHLPYSLDLERLQCLAAELIGRHDFSGLSQLSTDKYTTPLCRVLACHWVQTGDGLLAFTIKADHYLYKMVRTIIGTQVAIVSGRLAESFQREALAQKDRAKAGFVVPACGLRLESVEYTFPLFV